MNKNFLFFKNRKGIGYFLLVFILFFLMAIECVVFMNIKHMNDKMINSIEVKIPLAESTNSAEIKEIEGVLKEIEGTKNIQFVSKESGLDELLQKLKAEALSTETLRNANPLQPMLKVQVNDPEVINHIIKGLSNNNNIIEVVYGEQVIEKWMTYLKYLQPALIILFITKLLISAIAINRWHMHVQENQTSQTSLVAVIEKERPTTYLKNGFKVFIPMLLFVSYMVIAGYYYFFEFYEERISLSVIGLPEPISLSIWLIIFITVSGLISSTAGWGLFVRNQKRFA